MDFRIQKKITHLLEEDRAAGFLHLERARVRWFLSINYDLIPEHIKTIGQRTYRSIRVEGEDVEFSSGFTDLHTRSYEEILAGNGFGLNEAKPSIEIVHEIRNSTPIGLKGEYHPLCKR